MSSAQSTRVGEGGGKKQSRWCILSPGCCHCVALCWATVPCVLVTHVIERTRCRASASEFPYLGDDSSLSRCTACVHSGFLEENSFVENSSSRLVGGKAGVSSQRQDCLSAGHGNLTIVVIVTI